LIDFVMQMLVQYIDTILYRGDDSVDSNISKRAKKLTRDCEWQGQA